MVPVAVPFVRSIVRSSSPRLSSAGGDVDTPFDGCGHEFLYTLWGPGATYLETKDT